MDDVVSNTRQALHRGTDAAINATLQLLTDRARYDAEYAANKTGQLALIPGAMHTNMTAAAAALAAAVSGDLAVMDTGAGAALTATVGQCRLTPC